MRLRRWVLAVAAVLLTGYGGFLFAANFYPDETWCALTGTADLIHGFKPLQSISLRIERDTPDPYLDSDGYAVLSALKHSVANTGLAVVREDSAATSEPSRYSQCVPDNLRAHFGDILEDRDRQLSRKWQFENRFSPKEEFLLLSDQKLAPHDGRTAQSVEACITYSAVAFSPDRNRPAAYMALANVSGSHYGEAYGAIWFLEKRGSEWSISGKSVCDWYIEVCPMFLEASEIPVSASSKRKVSR